MGIEAFAVSRTEVVEDVVRGLLTLMFGDTAVAELQSKNIKIKAADPVELLVSTLNEIVYWSDKDNLVPAGLKINHMQETELSATITGESFDPRRHYVERQVKSVTYHQACLEEDAAGWHARVYVDL